MTDPAIVVQDLVKSFKTKRKVVKAVNGITFAVEKGEVFGLLGPNGAGKTTTMRVLATVIPPDSGTVLVKGHNLATHRVAIQETIGLVPENVTFYPNLSAMEHLSLYGSYYALAHLRESAKEMLSRVGLGAAENVKVREYSHGMKRRLALAQCLLHDPDILLLDEPGGGLDPQGIRFFRSLVRDLREAGKTVVLSSHLLSEVQMLADRIGILNHGDLIACDTLETLARRLDSVAGTTLLIRAEGFTEETLAKLGEVPGILRINRIGNAIEVQLMGGVDPIETVLPFLRATGVTVHFFSIEEKGLEDLFFKLTEGGA